MDDSWLLARDSRIMDHFLKQGSGVIKERVWPSGVDQGFYFGHTESDVHKISEWRYQVNSWIYKLEDQGEMEVRDRDLAVIYVDIFRVKELKEIPQGESVDGDERNHN